MEHFVHHFGSAGEFFFAEGSEGVVGEFGEVDRFATCKWVVGGDQDGEFGAADFFDLEFFADVVFGVADGLGIENANYGFRLEAKKFSQLLVFRLS